MVVPDKGQYGVSPIFSALALLSRGSAWLARVCVFVAGTGLVLLVIIFGWLVFGRYVLNDTPTWVEQVSLLLVAFITLLGAAVGVHENKHLGVDFFREKLPAGPKMAVKISGDALLVAFGILMAFKAGDLISNTWNREIPLLGISEAWRAVAMLVGGILIALFALTDVLNQIAARFQKRQ